MIAIFVWSFAASSLTTLAAVAQAEAARAAADVEQGKRRAAAQAEILDLLQRECSHDT